MCHSTAIPKYFKYPKFTADLWVCSCYTGISHCLLFLYNIKQLEFPTAVWILLHSTTLLWWSILQCFRLWPVPVGHSLAVCGRCSCVGAVGPVAGNHPVPVLLPFCLLGTAELLKDSLAASQRGAQALSCLVPLDGIFNVILNWLILGERNKEEEEYNDNINSASHIPSQKAWRTTVPIILTTFK